MEDTVMCPVCKVDLNFEYSAFKLDNFNGESAWFKSYVIAPSVAENIVGLRNSNSPAQVSRYVLAKEKSK